MKRFYNLLIVDNLNIDDLGTMHKENRQDVKEIRNGAASTVASRGRACNEATFLQERISGLEDVRRRLHLPGCRGDHHILPIRILDQLRGQRQYLRMRRYPRHLHVPQVQGVRQGGGK